MREGEGEKKSGFVGIEGTDIWLYNDTDFQVILNSTNNKLLATFRVTLW